MVRAMGWQTIVKPVLRPRESAKVQSHPIADIVALGSIDNARIAENLAEEADFHNLPEGWTFLGSGCYRTCYLGPDGIVYKVDSDEGEHSSNSVELRVFKECAHLMPESVRLCPTNYLSPRVNAMEMAGTQQGNLSNNLARLVTIATRGQGKWGGVSDLHGGNVRYDTLTDIYTIIDFAQ